MSKWADQDSITHWRLPLSNGGGYEVLRDRSPDAAETPKHRQAVPSPSVEKSAALPVARARRGLWRSPLARRILLLNMLALIIPVAGLLYLPTYRESLLHSEIELLRSEAKLFAGAVSASGVVTNEAGAERLDPEATRLTLHRLAQASRARARVFAPNGALIADSQHLTDFISEIVVYPLPPLDPHAGSLRLWAEIYDWIIASLPADPSLPPYTENIIQTATDYWEVPQALAGDAASFVRDAGNGGLVLSTAVPLQRYRQILGAVFLTKPATGVEEALRDTRLAILGVFAMALSVTILLSLYLASTIALPIHRLADAADHVRHAKGRQMPIPDLSRRDDEVGDLSVALKEMTEAVWQRMDAIERFAADVSHEIKNPLTSLRSAVETVARIEDPAQRKKLLAIIQDDVLRLDRLITDISDASRLDAELSRAEMREVKIRDLLAALADVHAVTAGSDGNAPLLRLDLGAAPDDDLAVPGLEGRLGQVLRNLIGNAISFSPPGGPIRLTARREDDCIRVVVEDEGPGIPPGKLSAIFERFYSERPQGEKFGLHSGLGLSISRQIVEAHGGTLIAENRMDEAGGIIGARFIMKLPAA